MRVSRRSVLLGTAGALALGATGAQAAGESEKQIYEAAKKEGQLTWYSGILNQQICSRIGEAFSKKYPGISVNAIKTTSQVAFQRLMQDVKGGAVQSDVFTTTDASHMAYLRGKDLLIKYVPANEKGMVKSLQNYDPEGYYTVTWVGLAAIAYNTNKVKAADAPKDWPDLTKPKWKNQVAFGSPNYSGMVGVWTIDMQDKFGWDFFKKLNKLNPMIGRSIDDAATVLNSGEREVALASAATILRSAAKGNPVAVVYPTSGTVAVISPSGIIKGCKSPNAGKLFMEFLSGPEFSKILAENYEQPIRTDVPPPKGAKPLSELKLDIVPLKTIEKEITQVKEKWRDTFG